MEFIQDLDTCKLKISPLVKGSGTIHLIPATFTKPVSLAASRQEIFLGLCVGPMQGARSPDGRSWRSGQFGRSFCSQGSVMKDISEGFRGKPLICSLLGSYMFSFCL